MHFPEHSLNPCSLRVRHAGLRSAVLGQMWFSALGLGSFWSVCAVGPAPIKLNSGPEGFQEPGHTQGCSERVQDTTESSSFCSVPGEVWTAR